jgi:hypothetical protein
MRRIIMITHDESLDRMSALNKLATTTQTTGNQLHK